MAKATEQIMRRACTQFAEPPRRFHARPIFKWGLYEHLRGAITGITVDATADEVLGAEMMRTLALTQEMHALAPNTRHVLRDKAHASRRLTSRPYAADPFLKDVLIMSKATHQMGGERACLSTPPASQASSSVWHEAHLALCCQVMPCRA